MIFDPVWRAQRYRNKTADQYDKEIKKCRVRKDYDGAVVLEAKAASAVHDLDTNVKILTSRALVSKAHQLHLPVPEFIEKESWGNFRGSYVLTPKAYSTLRTLIRQELRDRRESWIAWVKEVLIPIAGILISLGSLTVAYRALACRADVQQSTKQSASDTAVQPPQPAVAEPRKR